LNRKNSYLYTAFTLIMQIGFFKDEITILLRVSYKSIVTKYINNLKISYLTLVFLRSSII